MQSEKSFRKNILLSLLLHGAQEKNLPRDCMGLMPECGLRMLGWHSWLTEKNADAGPTEPSWAVMHPTELHCNLLSYVAIYWCTLHPTELRCTRLRYAASYWAMLHPSEVHCTQYTEQWCTLLSNDATYWITLHHGSYTAPCWATLFGTELFFNPTELRKLYLATLHVFTLLIYAASSWVM